MRLEYSESHSPPDNPIVSSPLEIEGRLIAVDEAGYLLDAETWSPAVTEAQAKSDGVELNDDHWLLIDFLHRFYKEYGIAPEIPILARNLCKDQHNCRWNKRYIETLFPGGAKTACRYAGLSKPVGRSCL